MLKKISFILVAIIATTQAFSQCACCAGACSGSSNGDYNNGILTLQKKQFVLEGYAEYRTIKIMQEQQVSSDSMTEEETPLKTMLLYSVGLRYGISNKITVSALLPYTFLHTDNGNDKGMGDLILLGTYNVYSKNNLNVALQAGVELPTGIQKNSNFDNTTVVLGSGSVDPMAGVLFSKRWDKLTLNGNALYKHTTAGFEKNYYGSLSVQNLAWMYRLKGENLDCARDSSTNKKHIELGWTLMAGYHGEWLDNIKEGEEVDRNSGYYLGYATLGTNFSYRKWALPVTLSLPIVQRMNGDQNDAGLRLRIGIIKLL